MPNPTLNYTPLAQALTEVDRVTQTYLHSDVSLVQQVAEYIVKAGGKRMRPALLILSAQACGYAGSQQHLLAAVIELIHTATLLHDDVVDESALRRGAATANATFGNAASVLVGDFLYSRAFQMMVEAKNLRVLEILSDATNVIAEGEVMQLINVRNPALTEAQYFAVIESKTAKLFEAAAQIGAVIAEATPEIETALCQFGMQLGTAFQLIDDILDYSGESTLIGKNLGDDLAEGKMTLPLIYAMARGSTSERAIIENAILHGSGEHFSETLDIIVNTHAITHARATAERTIKQALASLAILPNDENRAALENLALQAIDRVR